MGTLLISKIREEYPDRIMNTFSVIPSPKVWQYGLWSFQTGGGGGTKLERFLPKNQHTQRK